METLIIIHATDTPADMPVTPADDPIYNEPYFDVQQWLNNSDN